MRTRKIFRFTFVIAGLALLGILAAGYVLYYERAPVPLRDTYDLRVELRSADGVQPGLGQPVNVAGVKVGSIVKERFGGANAVVTLRITRSQIPAVYRDATATLSPITPLKDMEIQLHPGRPRSGRMPEGAMISATRTSTPVPLSDLLSTLDADTRGFMTSLLASLDQGSRGRGEDFRRAMVALGPTTAQVREITRGLATRRASIARLVSNLSRVTRAASQDHQLVDVVKAGDATIGALATQEAPLRQAIGKLPSTLATTRSTLSSAATLSDQLGPTLDALTPPTQRLPGTVRRLGGFSRSVSVDLRDKVRPFVRRAAPVLADLAPATTKLTSLTPDLTAAFKVLNYFFNELAYNAPGDDEGFLFWGGWFFHNGNSVFSLADAHGSIGRAALYSTCSQAVGAGAVGNGAVGDVLLGSLGLLNACSGDR